MMADVTEIEPPEVPPLPGCQTIGVFVSGAVDADEAMDAVHAKYADAGKTFKRAGVVVKVIYTSLGAESAKYSWTGYLRVKPELPHA